MGRRINGRFDSAKSFTKRIVRFTGWSALVLGSIVIAGKMLSTDTVTVAQAEVVQLPVQAPVLDRIADCESGNGKPRSAMHYKNGQVLLKANTNGTIDIGKYQVNLTYWGAKATELGLDLTKEADNKKMAEWIYANKGTGDWSASHQCWYR